MDGLGRVAAAGRLLQAAIPNCTSNNAGTAGARGLAEVKCFLNVTTPSSSASHLVNKT